MHIFIHIQTYVCTHGRMCTCMYVCLYLCTCASGCVYVRMRAGVCMSECMCVLRMLTILADESGTANSQLVSISTQEDRCRYNNTHSNHMYIYIYIYVMQCAIT